MFWSLGCCELKAPPSSPRKGSLPWAAAPGIPSSHEEGVRLWMIHTCSLLFVYKNTCFTVCPKLSVFSHITSQTSLHISVRTPPLFSPTSQQVGEIELCSSFYFTSSWVLLLSCASVSLGWNPKRGNILKCQADYSSPMVYEAPFPCSSTSKVLSQFILEHLSVGFSKGAF